ncbi:tyrosine-type recombinase/integrase [Rhodococcus hoagii]|nr:tyrosine-type recombinase/integrase [Prescottella equi]
MTAPGPTLGKAYKRASDGLWVVPISLGTGPDGKRRRVTVARKLKRDANAAAQDKLTELQNGTVVKGGPTTVEAWMNYWLENVAAARGLTPNTLRSYRSRVKNSIVPTIGHLQLAKLEPLHVRRMHTELAARGLSIGTARLVHVVLSQALDDAVADDLLAKNPTARIALPRNDADADDGLPPLDLEQARHLIETSYRAGDPMWLRYAVALLTGQRQGEVIGLQADRINFADGYLDLSWALVSAGQVHGCGDTRAGEPSCGHPRNRPRLCPAVRLNVARGYAHRPLLGALALGRPKTKGSKRLIPLIGPIADGLREHLASTPTNPWGLVWTNPRTNTPIHPASDHRNWHRALVRAGLPAVNIHSARHTAATVLQSMNVPEDVRMQLLGHNSKATHRIYAHVDQELARAALKDYGTALGLTG